MKKNQMTMLISVTWLAFLVGSWHVLPTVFARESVPVHYLCQLVADHDPPFEGPAIITGRTLGRILVDGVNAVSVRGDTTALLAAALPSGIHGSTFLNVSAFADPGVKQSIYVQTLGARPVLIARSSQWVNQNFDLTTFLTVDRPSRVVLEIDRPAGLAQTMVSDWSIRTIPSANGFPLIPLFLIATLCMLFAVETLIRLSVSYRIQTLVVVLLGLGLLAGARGTVWGLDQPWAWIGLLTLILFFRHFRSRATHSISVGPHELLWLPITMALSWRWNELKLTQGFGLAWSDAEAYRHFALTFQPTHPFATNFREPLIVWVHYLTMSLMGPAEIHVRLASVFFSVLIVPATYFFALIVSGRRTVAWLAAFMTAYSNFLIYISVLGGRNDLYTLLMLALSIALVSWKAKRAKTEVGLGVLGGLLSMTWLIGLLGAGLAYLWRWRHFKISFSHATLFYIVLIASVTPNLFQQWRAHGDPLYSINFNTPEFQKIQEGKSQESSGQAITWFGYLAHQKGLFELSKTVIEGYGQILFNPTNRYNKILLGFHYSQILSYFLFPFLILGLISEARKKHAVPFAFLVAFVNVMPAFLKIPHPRLFLHAAPYVAYFWAAGFDEVLRYLRLHLEIIKTHSPKSTVRPI